MKHLFLLALLALGILTRAQENLWPDSGFEQNGVDSGRTGKCLRLYTEKVQHWVHPGERTIKVTPFATYELAVWVKGKATTGTINVLYTYGYNCYGWFTCGEPYPNISEAKDWTRYTRRVTPINPTIAICPISVLGNGAGEFFADDMTVTQVMSPEESIAHFEKLPQKDTGVRQALMRWYLLHDNVPAAQAVIDPKNQREQAEFHCLMAQRATAEADKLAHVSAMLANGCCDFPDANQRLTELLRGVPMQARLEACLNGLKQYQGSNPKQWDCLLQTFDIHAPTSFEDARSQKQRLLNACDTIKAFVADKKTDTDWSQKLDALCREKLTVLNDWLNDCGYCRVTLAGHPLEQAVIILPTQPTLSETKAAEQLKLYLEKQTRQCLPVAAWGQENNRYPIYIGRLPQNAQNVGPVDYEHLRFDGIHIELTPGCLLLGGGQRGVLYAVFTFLEEQLGWRWFTDDCVTSPKDGTFAIKPFKNIYVPHFDYRRTSYIQFKNPELIVPLKLNAMDKKEPEWGGNYLYRGWVHTFQSLVPASVYAKDHPEYYSLINGKRVTQRTQLCLTNPEVLAIATDTVRKWLKDSNPLPFAVSVSQNDWRNYCQCPNCTALAEKEGSQSGPLLHFVNGIADAIAKEYPTVKIDTLAYVYTRKAPKFVRPRPNVIVRLCSIECCFAHGLDECEANRSFVKDIEDWSKISPFLSIWDYTINFAHSTQPFPNLRVLQKNVQFYRKWGVKGLFEQGNRFTKGGEFMDLRAYLIAKLLWNPDADVPALIRDFTDAYYGNAAPYIRTYIEYMHDWLCGTPEKPTTIKIGIYAPPQHYLNNPEKLAEADAILEQAEAAVRGQEPYATRAAVAHMPLWYTRLQLTQTVFVPDKDGNLVIPSSDTVNIADRFAKAAAAVKLTSIREGGNYNGYLDWLNQRRTRLAKTVCKLETLKNAHGTLTVIPSLGGRVWSCQDTAGHEMMNIAGDSLNGYQPFGGGYEEFGSDAYQSPGYTEAYTVTERDDTHITLKASLPGGKTITRRYDLLPDRAGFSVTSELTGKGQLVLRSHPMFAAPDLKHTSVWLWLDGKWREQPLSETENSNLYFQNDLRPQSKWGFVSRTTNQGVLNTFTAENVDFCYINAKHEDNRLNLEQWSRPQDGRAVLKNTYEFWQK